MNKAQRLDAALRGTSEATPEISGMVFAARQMESQASVPPMNPDELRAARQAFLAEAQRLRVEAAQPTWLERVMGPLRSKSPRRSFLPAPVLAALILVLCFMIGMTGLDLASQNALPGDGLYGYKLWREQVTVVLAFSPAQKADSHLHAIRARNQELRELAQLGRPIPEQTIQRLQRSLEDVLQAVTRLPDPAMQARLMEIRVLSNETLALIGTNVCIDGALTIESLEGMAAAALNTESLANLGLSDPDAFRTQMAAPRTEDVTTIAPTATVKVVLPTQGPTLVIMMPSATPVTVNFPPLQPLLPTPTCTCTQPAPTATQPWVEPTTAPTTAPSRTDPPPMVPTPTEIIIAPTQGPLTPTPTLDEGPLFPTPTPVTQERDE